MKRTKHSLSHYKLLTAEMGLLYPIACFEVLPGDTIQQVTSLLVRVSPLLAPVMHPVSVRVHHWFVPNRLVWDDWEDFITGGSDGLGDGAAYPVFGANPAGQPAKGLMDYFGIPPGVAHPELSAMPFRAYSAIYNENYRDQDLVPERVYSTAGGPDTTTEITMARIAWEKDYFGIARPWAQKGPDVSMPLGVSAPVVSAGPGLGPQFTAPGVASSGIGAAPGQINMTWANAPTGAGNAAWLNTNLQADLSNASAVNVNDVRRAFAIQRYQEARAQYGSRYTEYLRYLGVRSSDARLQRPEYLGGGKQTISFSEVLRTGSESTAPIGELAGHGIAAMRSRRYRRFFEEHGHVISLLSVRPRVIYNDGLERMWNRRIKEDYWQKELELIGQQEILNKEVFSSHAAPDGVWGFGDRYSDYRHLWSKVHGEFRDTLNYWHMARIFATAPVLNNSFVLCDPTKRIHAEQTMDTLWIMANHSIQARRMVGNRTIGRIM